MERIQLFFQNATEVVDGDNVGLLILTDSFQERQLAMPCEEPQLGEFRTRLRKKPEAGRSLADVLLKVIRWQTDLDLEIVITGIEKGRYTAFLENVDTLEQVSLNAADAVLLSFISKGKIPIYINEELFLKQSTPYDVRAKGVALPVNSLSMGMLRKELAKAVKSENYELASQLRDEMARRTGKNEKKKE